MVILYNVLARDMPIPAPHFMGCFLEKNLPVFSGSIL